MREIDMGEAPKDQLPVNSFLIHGDTKTGKSTFAATAPRPLFLSDGTEHGFESLRDENWNDELTPRFEGDVRPIVWALDKEADFTEAVERARPLVQAGLILSVWVDSITFFADLIFNSILMGQAKRDTRAAYGELGVRLRNVRIKVASLGVTYGFLALTKHPGDDDPIGRPMIPGQQGDKLAAGCDFVWHSRMEQPMPTKPPTFDLHTRRYANHIAGNRLGPRAAMLPSPFRGTFAEYLATLDYDIDGIRAKLPPLDKARARAAQLAEAAKKAAQVESKPPIVAGAQPAAVKPTGQPAAKSTVIIRPATPNNSKTVTPTAKQ